MTLPRWLRPQLSNMRACRKYWLTEVSSLVSTALRVRMIAGSPFMAMSSGRAAHRRESPRGSRPRITRSAAPCSLANTSHDIENASKTRLQLLGGEGEGLAPVVDHFAHFADAAGAAGTALVTAEHVLRTRRARLDGEGHITLAKAVAVADVHGRNHRELRTVRY